MINPKIKKPIIDTAHGYLRTFRGHPDLIVLVSGGSSGTKGTVIHTGTNSDYYAIGEYIENWTNDQQALTFNGIITLNNV
jgi:hypothetical protein